MKRNRILSTFKKAILQVSFSWKWTLLHNKENIKRV